MDGDTPPPSDAPYGGWVGRLGNDQANWNEFQLASSLTLRMDGEDVTTRIGGRIMEVNGRALVWGRGFVNLLNDHASRYGGMWPWIDVALAEWDGENGTMKYTYSNAVVDNEGSAITPTVVWFRPGLHRGCGSTVMTASWRASFNQDVVGPFRRNDKLDLDAPACNFFLSEKTYVPLRALTEAFKLRMDFNSLTNTVDIYTRQVPNPHVGEFGNIVFNHNSSGFHLSVPEGGFRAYPSTLMFSALAAYYSNKVISKIGDDGNYSFMADQSTNSLMMHDPFGNLKARIYPTHFVVYYNEQQASDLAYQLKHDNRYSTGAGTVFSVLVPGEVFYKVLSAVGTVAYYSGRDTDVDKINKCIAQAEKPKLIGVVYVNPAEFELASRFLSSGIRGCVSGDRFVSADAAIGGF
ncbi:MAG TPA: hypothetical protein VGK74_11855 [Symbiobacteriaceae bacterium]|jgi:hypothetical protein